MRRFIRGLSDLCHFAGILFITLVGVAAAHASELVNDGWTSGGSAGFQGGFVTGEIGAARFDPAGPCPCFVSSVSFLFGGAVGTETIILHIWDDASGVAIPGPEIFSRQYQVMASNSDLQVIDLSADGVFVNGQFRVGIEITHNGLPSIARDDDGNIQSDTNFLLVSGLVWSESSFLGLTGDWIIRATVEPQGDLADEIKIDSWPPTLTAVFQGGFQIGETAAVRLTPPGPCPCPVNGVSVLVGGASGMVSMGLRIWDDSALTPDPGSQIYTAEIDLAAADAAFNFIDLSPELVSVDGPFRLGFVMNSAGFPSVARDDDGMTPGVNFIDELTLGWLDSGSLGVTGDWIMRAVVTDQNLQTAVLGFDNWDSILLPAFQAGFQSGEMAAVRLAPGITCPCLVTSARLMFGGAPGTVPVTLRVWEDSAGAIPGSELFSAPMTMLDGNDFALNVIDLSATPILVNGAFRIGVEFSQGGAPSVARDHDGTLPGRNFIFDSGIGWIDATDSGVPGDWIIRASVIPEVIFLQSFESP